MDYAAGHVDGGVFFEEISVVSFITTRTDAFIDRIRSTSWKTELSKGHSFANL